MWNPRSVGYDRENHTSGNSRKWTRKSRTSSSRPVTKESLQEKWDRINPFQKSLHEPLVDQDRHEHNALIQKNDGPATPSLGDSQSEGVEKCPAEQQTKLTSEEFEPVEQPSSRRLVFGQENSDSARKHHIQLVIKELKSKVRRTTRTGGHGQTKGFEYSGTARLSRDLEPTESLPTGCKESILDTSAAKEKDLLSPPSAAVPPEVRNDSPGNWIDKMARISRNKGSEANATRKGRPPTQGRGRGGLLGIGKGAQNSIKFAAFFQGIARERQDSPDSGEGRRTWLQPGLRGLQGVLRKVRSYDSDPASRSSTRCKNSCRCCRDVVPSRDNLVVLEKSLWKAEVMLAALVERQAKDRLEFSRQVSSIRDTCNAIKRKQEIHYQNVLDEFNENYRVMGNVESHFGYVTSLMRRGRPRSDVGTEILRMLGDNTIAFLLDIVRTSTSVFFYFFPRNKNNRN